MGRVSGIRYWLQWPDGRVYQDPSGGTFHIERKDPETAEIMMRSRARAREAKGLGHLTVRRALAIEKNC